VASPLTRILAFLKPTNLLALAVLAAIVYGATIYVAYTRRAERVARERQELAATVAQLEEKNQTLRATVQKLEAQAAELRTHVKRLTADTRVARVRITGQRLDAEGMPLTTLEFAEADRGEKAPPPRVVTVRGEEVYFDALVIRFDDDQVKVGDPLRGKSLHLFRRVFGSAQEPRQGPLLGPSEAEAAAAAPSAPVASAFERSLWLRFWHWADHPKEAEREGVRVAQIEAVGIRPILGATYRITLRHSGGLEIRRLEEEK